VTYLSNFYLDTAKDRLYFRAADSGSRRACQTVLAACLRHMTVCLAPLAPHLAEEAYGATPCRPADAPASIFQAGWPAVPAAWLAPPPAAEADAVWEALLTARAELNKLAEAARSDKAWGANLDARAMLCFGGEGEAVSALRDALTAFADVPGAVDGSDELRYLFLVSSATLAASEAELNEFIADGAGCYAARDLPLPGGCGSVSLALRRAAGAKCERCWGFSALVGASRRHPTLCERCDAVADSLALPPAEALRAAAAERAAASAASAASAV